eukprot:TRINITY_DN28649_c0_g1_i1.p2 TRINITY_DN28649_c0_g1~~TRINITY_DN28649_c0_g1_i1.p2  ORF type:complete len:153 (+),score=25.08 TRINITY_DN28649_c0_g1_i1:246-704(+)
MSWSIYVLTFCLFYVKGEHTDAEQLKRLHACLNLAYIKLEKDYDIWSKMIYHGSSSFTLDQKHNKLRCAMLKRCNNLLPEKLVKYYSNDGISKFMKSSHENYVNIKYSKYNKKKLTLSRKERLLVKMVEKIEEDAQKKEGIMSILNLSLIHI